MTNKKDQKPAERPEYPDEGNGYRSGRKKIVAAIIGQVVSWLFRLVRRKF